MTERKLTGMAWKPTVEQADELLRHIARGKTLADWLRSTPDAPSRDTVERWLKADPDAAVAMQYARDAGHDEIADDALRIADEQPPPGAMGGTDAGYVSWQKNRVWTRLQLLAKWNPKRYGDKLAVEQTVKRDVADYTDEELAGVIAAREAK